MNLYRISQPSDFNFDYDAAIVSAESEDEARVMYPGDPFNADDRYGWVSPEHVTVELIGRAREGLEAGVVCAESNCDFGARPNPLLGLECVVFNVDTGTAIEPPE